jgi:hypothetical protein
MGGSNVAKHNESETPMEQSPELLRQFLEDRLPPVFSRAQLYEAVDKLMFTPKSMINFANRGIGPKFFYMGVRVMYEKASFIEWAMQKFGGATRNDYRRNRISLGGRKVAQDLSGEGGAGSQGAGD